MYQRTFSIKDVKVDEAGNQLIKDAILEGLRSYSAPWLGLGKLQPFSLYTHNSSSKLTAGISGAVRQYPSFKTAWIHKIWVEPSYRRQGIGRNLMNYLDYFACNKNCQNMQIEVFEFQSVEFFKKQGYWIEGILPKAIACKDQYFLRKQPSSSVVVSSGFSSVLLDETDNKKIKQTIARGVSDFNEPYFGPESQEDFSLYIENDKGIIISGITGKAGQKYAWVNVMWVDQSYRGRGLGRLLWQQLENYLVSKNCPLVLVGTLEFQAKLFYEKLGCRHQGTIQAWMGGYDQHFFEKKLF